MIYLLYTYAGSALLMLLFVLRHRRLLVDLLKNFPLVPTFLIAVCCPVVNTVLLILLLVAWVRSLGI